VVRAPPQPQAHVDGAMEVSKCLLLGLQVNVRGGCLGGAKDAGRRENIWTRADGCVMEIALEVGVDVLGHPRGGVGRPCVRGLSIYQLVPSAKSPSRYYVLLTLTLTYY
jgi:hypothetical protein